MLTIKGARLLADGLPGEVAGTADGVAPGLFDVTVRGSVIERVSKASGPTAGASAETETIDARGRLLIPGFVDCHTHACYHDPDGSHRLDEWDQKRAGVAYLDILARGGGIMASVRAVRSASQAALTEQLLVRLAIMLRHGSTTIEVKSGYGLRPADEMKMLRAIADARQTFGGTIVATALLGHAIDPDVERGRFVSSMVHETLDAVGAEFGRGIAVDAFCEQGAWSLEECAALFERARGFGHPVRVHADQFSSMGMVPWAIEHGAVSVDHLEATAAVDRARLAGSGVYAVGLPACGLHVDGRYANLAGLERACIATNLNPGSSPCYSMPLIVALAVRKCGLSPLHALRAATTTPARLLGFEDRGRVRTGARADLVLLRHTDPRALAFAMGDNPCDVVVCGGAVVHRT